MSSTQFYQRAPSSLALDASGNTSQTGSSTVGGNENVSGNVSAGGYVVGQSFKFGTVPNGANGFGLKISPNAYYGAQLAYTDGAGNSTFTTFLNVNKFARGVSGATGAVNRDYDANGCIAVSTNGTCVLTLANVSAAGYLNGLIGLDCIVAAYTANTALQIVAGSASDVIVVAGVGPSSAGGSISCAAGQYGAVALTCVAASQWIARVTGTWTKA